MFSRVVAVAALLAAVASASQVIREPEDKDFMTVRMNALRLTYLPPPMTDVRTYSKIVGANSEDEIPLNKQVTLLCGIVNEGDQPINVTGIMGSLNMPESFQFYYVNFTYKFFGDVVEPGQEMAFGYTFKLRPEDLIGVNERAEETPTRAQMAMSVFYEEESHTSEYSAAFFNETVSFVPGEQSVDVGFVQQFVVDAIVGGSILFAVAYGVMGADAVKAVVGDEALSTGDKSASAADAAAPSSSKSKSKNQPKSKSKSKKGKGH